MFKIALRKKIKLLKIGKFFVFVLLFAKKKEIEYNFIEKTRFTEWDLSIYRKFIDC